MCHRQRRDEPQLHGTPHGTPCVPPPPPFITMGSSGRPQSSSALLCTLTSGCTWICTNLWAEEIGIAPHSAPKSAGFLSPHISLPTGHKWSVSLESPRTALFHKKRIKVASPAVPTCGPPCSGNPGGPENAQFSSEAHQRLPGLFPTSEATDLSAFSVTISHQKKTPLF